MNRLLSIVAAALISLSCQALATVPVTNVAITLCSDGTANSGVTDGNCVPTPPYENLSWDLSTHLADNGINIIACETVGTDFSYNVRQHLSGTNAGTATITVTTMSGSTWSSGGNSPGAGNNLTFECPANLDYAGSIRLNADDGTSADTSTTKTWAAFADTTPPPEDRVGIILEASGSTLDACSNCQVADLHADPSVSVDGFRVKHLANEQYYSGAVPAVVQALDHWSIIGGSGTVGADSGVTSIDGDNRWFRGTLYPEPYDPPGPTYGSTDLDYGPLNGGAPDKPRTDFLMKQSAEAVHGTNNNLFSDRTDHWISFAVYMPSDYEEECNDGWQEAVLQYISQYTSPNNQFSLDINGIGSCGTGNSEWSMERWVAAPGASSGTKPGSLASETPVTEAMKGAWIFHTIYFNIDNRTSGATPKFEWWITDESCTQLHNYVDNTSRWGFDSSGAAHDYPNWNQVYKGGWHNYTSGTYDGPKTDPVQMGFDAFRVGDATSSFYDVHPIRCTEP